MKVKCIYNKRMNKEGEYQSLSIGREYIVLAIEFYNSKESFFTETIGDFVLFRLKDNDDVVLPYPAKLFKIISDTLPNCWVIHKEDNDVYSILPKEWAIKGFWDDYYNDCEYAIKKFKEVEKELIPNS